MKLKLDDQGHVVVQDGKPVYVHDDGRELPFDAAGTAQAIARLNAEAKSHREGKETAEARLKAFEGIEDGEAARKALETVKNIKDGELIAAGKMEEIRTAAKKAAEEQVAAASKQYTEELAKARTERDKFQSELFEERIGGSFERSKFIADKLAIPADMVRAAFGKAFKIEDGKVVAYDAAGNKVFSRVRPGDIADFDEAIETLVESYPYKDRILKGSGASGGGAQGGAAGSGGAKTLNRAAFGALSPADQAAHVKSGGAITD